LEEVGAVLLSILLAAAVFLWPQNAAGQQSAVRRLTLSQVEELVSHHVPDATMQREIQRRGLAFTPTAAVLESLRAKGAGLLTLAEISALEPKGAGPRAGRIPVPGMSAPVSEPAQLTLEVARRALPAILTQIYRSLDAGDPQAARQFLSGDVLNDAQQLDAICMPFSYRAHYVSSVIERPGPVFEARVRTLFKPFEAKAQVFTFQPYMGTFMLLRVEKDPLAAEIDSAQEAVRQFIFAVRAGTWDVAARYASPGLPLEQMKSPDWAEYFSKITSAKVSSDDIRTKGGLLLLIRVDVRGYSSYLPDFLVDPESGLIVRAFFRSPENIFSQLPDPDGFTDPDAEANFLKRFGLTKDMDRSEAAQGDLAAPGGGSNETLDGTDQGPADQQGARLPDGEADGVYRVGGAISAPVILYGPQAVYSAEARRAHLQGKCLVSLVVDTRGNPQNVQVVHPLGKGLDEKAIEAVKQFRFTPATRNGITPVPVKIAVQVEFRLY
jgi:TonB family protein